MNNKELREAECMENFEDWKKYYEAFKAGSEAAVSNVKEKAKELTAKKPSALEKGLLVGCIFIVGLIAGIAISHCPHSCCKKKTNACGCRHEEMDEE